MASQRKVILVIDDDADIAESIQDLLELDGFNAVTAPNGERGLATLDTLAPEHCPVLIICDMVMPVLDGLGFLRAYRARSDARAPVLAVSALAPYLLQARTLGAAATLPKPFSVDELRSAVAAAIAGAPSEPARTAAPDASPQADARRLREISELRLDTPALSAALDTFLSKVAHEFNVSTALVSIVTATRQYWTSGFGIPADLLKDRGTTVSQAFCVHAVASRSPLVVQDATDNPFFADNPLVRSRRLRFYAGVPVFTRSGEAVGTLCIFDKHERLFTHHDLHLLRVLARRVMAEIEAHERTLRPDRVPSGFHYSAYVDSELGIFGRNGLTELLDALSLRHSDRRHSLTLAVSQIPTPELTAAVTRLKQTFSDGWYGRLSANRVGIIIRDQAPDSAAARARGVLPADARVVALPANARIEAALTLLRDAEALLPQ